MAERDGLCQRSISDWYLTLPHQSPMPSKCPPPKQSMQQLYAVTAAPAAYTKPLTPWPSFAFWPLPPQPFFRPPLPPLFFRPLLPPHPSRPSRPPPLSELFQLPPPIMPLLPAASVTPPSHTSPSQGQSRACESECPPCLTWKSWASWLTFFFVGEGATFYFFECKGL